MSRKILPEDRKAIDLVLDSAVSSLRPEAARKYVSTADSANGKVQMVQQILKLLEMLPVSEPPIDLVTRTMARVGQDVGSMIAPHPVSAAIASQQQA